MNMKKVYLCSPLGGDIESNIELAKKYAEYMLKKCGVTPVIPHFYALILNDNDPEERKVGLAASSSLLWFCDEIWVFGDVITSGMQDEIKLAKNLNIRIKYFSSEWINRNLNIGGEAHEKK